MAEKSGTGIIIGRFQVFELNEVHQRLIAQVQAAHKRVVIFLGSNPAPSDVNPLDWIFRWKMLEEHFGDAIEVLEMPDTPDDRIWSQELDRRILELRPEGSIVKLYGSALGFVGRYSGRYESEILDADGDALDEDIISVDGITNHRDFRAGVIFGMLRRFPTTYPTVDVAVFRKEQTEVLLARKSNEMRYRFPGGFVDPSDESFEDAAERELLEECGVLDTDDWVYLGSCSVDDWRYRDSSDGIITHLYACNLVEGTPEPNDDIAELHWHATARLSEDIFVSEHRPLFHLLRQFLDETLT
jgi:bifunctional NMN adenylyltransferase/nudix hydrolase